MTSLGLATPPRTSAVRWIDTNQLIANAFSQAIYGDPDAETEGLLDSIRLQGILEPLIVARAADPQAWEVLSGHRRLSCARTLGLAEVPCLVSALPPGPERDRLVLDANRQRTKSFTQRMREADALEKLLAVEARRRRQANLKRGTEPPDRRNSDHRTGRTDQAIAQAVGLGGKDQFRQARAVWKAAQNGDTRARNAVTLLDAGQKTIHAAYKDLRRRDHLTTGFTPTPYDVWSFRHDRAYGLPHPGSIPAGIIAHAIHYFTPAGGLVVDPMAGGGTTLDVCQAMGRRCLAYDLAPVRPEIRRHDLRHGLPPETTGCDLIFADPPYHTMLARQYAPDSLSAQPLTAWIAFLQDFSRAAFLQLRPGGHLALLLANQTEKDLPVGHGYLDHAFLGYSALVAAGFLPVRRISCPMSGAYQPQQIRRAREEGRLLGLVRDLIVMRKPA